MSTDTQLDTDELMGRLSHEQAAQARAAADMSWTVIVCERLGAMVFAERLPTPIEQIFSGDGTVWLTFATMADRDRWADRIGARRDDLNCWWGHLDGRVVVVSVRP